MKIKKMLSIILSAAICSVTLAGCGAAKETKSSAKPVILAVSFGTSYNDTREKTIGAIEKAIAKAYPEYEVRRAFTSQTVIDIIKERDNIETDNVEQAFEKLVADGVKELKVQPTHIMSGYEYNDLAAEVEKYADKFSSVVIGAPLLTDDEDYTDVVNALTAETADYSKEDTAIVFMGHGTEHKSNEVYTKLQERFKESGAENYFIGTVEAEPTLDDVIAEVKKGGYSKVVLEPLMVVAGDHANNDMAGDEDGSWKKVFEAEGFEVEAVLKGLGEIEAIQQIYVKHIK